MNALIALVQSAAYLLIASALRFALLIDKLTTRLVGRLRKLRGSIAALRRRWLLRNGVTPDGWRPSRRTPHNRTPAHLEERVVRLHVEQPHLGARQLQMLAARVLGFRAHASTFGRILGRRRDLLVSMEQAKRRRKRRIVVPQRNLLWGVDLTLVFILGVFPVWLLGVVDYHGSKLVLLQRCRPTTAAISALLRQAFDEHGRPDRLLTDNGSQFTSLDFELFLTAHDIEHTRTRPAHPWTNGRIERLFRTFKEEIFRHLWLFASLRQIDRYCADFVQLYNRDRPHSAYGGRTPNEVFFGLKRKARPQGRVSYFDGALSWYRFG